jgi:integrase
MPRAPKPLPPIDIRDARIPGGRLKLSSKATTRPEHRRREAAVRALVDAGEWGVIEGLRARRLHIADVQRAVEEGDVARLRPTAAMRVLGDEADRMLRTVAATRSEGTRAVYDVILRQLRAHFGDALPMHTLTVEAAEAWLHAPQASNGGRPWSPARQALVVACCGRLWRGAIEAAGEVADRENARAALRLNPWAKVATAGEVRPRVAYLRRPQWERLLDTVRGTERAAVYGLACLAGLRRDEVVNLRTGLDVELRDGHRGRVRIQPRGGDHAWRPKSARGVRDVPMSRTLEEILRYHAEVYAGETWFIRSPRGDSRISPDTVARWLARDFAAAGIPYGRAGSSLTLHSLRHTFASWLVQADAQLLKVSRLLGDTVDMVERVYGHLLPADLERLVDLMDAAGDVASATSTENDTVNDAGA